MTVRNFPHLVLRKPVERGRVVRKMPRPANLEAGGTLRFYLAGFTFERAMGGVLKLLKSGDWEVVGDGFKDVNVFVKSLSLDKFTVVAEQRNEFRNKVQELQPKVSNRSIAKALGVNPSTVDRDVAANAAPGTRKELGNGKGSAANAHQAHLTADGTLRF
jgi:hypothetical protein